MSPKRDAMIGRDVYSRLVQDYEPLAFEEVWTTERRRFRIPMNHVLKNRERFWEALRTASRYFPPQDDNCTIADLGTFPGSLLRLLRNLLSPRECRLIGIGLMISEDFRQAMVNSCGAEILTANLDPRNDQLRDKGYPSRIPLDEDNVDVVFALEVIEHLLSPSHLFAEAFRICRPGGHVIVTTPNVTRIGNVFKLLIGRSNFDRLIPPDYDDPNDEWRPHFREYAIAEVVGFFKRAGFEVVEQRHAIAEDTRYNVKSSSQRLVDLAKLPFSMVPHLRGTLVVVGQKPHVPDKVS